MSGKNVPALRFPGFEGDWKRQNIGDLSEKITSGSRDWAKYYSMSGDKFIRMTNLQRDGVIDLDLTDLRYVSLGGNGSEGERTSLRAGDILVSITAELGKIGLVPDGLGTAYINQHTALVRPIASSTTPRFLAQNLARLKSNRALNRLNDAGAKAGLNLGTIAKFSVHIPTRPEQEKIASFLGAVDEKISGLEKKKALLEAYKRGVMQKLFSRALRFKDAQGRDFPDWEEKRLRDVAHKTASSIIASSLEASPGDYPVFGASGIVGYVDYFSSDEPHVSVVKDGAGVGRLFFCPPRSSVLGTLESVSATGGNSTKFIYYWMSQINFRVYSTGSTIPHVYFKDYGKKKGRFPHPAEQRKIADFLSAIDAKLDLVTQEMTQAKTFKKGLLQQMFV